MLRKTLTILSLIGLLLSVGLWAVSYLQVGITSSRNYLQIINGHMIWSHSPEDWDIQEREASLDFMDTSYFHVGGSCFVFVTKIRLRNEWWLLPRIRRNTSGIVASMPLWMCTLLFVSLAGLCRPLHHRRRRKRKKLGLCVNCGYDLRASKDRCPECGAGFSN